MPAADRVAYFDNDGTLWCERPNYVQLDFFLDALRKRVAQDPSIGERDEFAALLSGDQAAVTGIGLQRIALALAGLFEGMKPEEFAAAAREFIGRAAHPTLGRPTRSVTYQPMLELIAELRRRDFTVGIVTGGGTEFVRAISDDLYGVPAELVVGTLIGYDVSRDGESPPVIRRTSDLLGVANEGSAKVANIQTQLGRRPILAAGNSGGDRGDAGMGAGHRFSQPCAADRPRRRRARISLHQHGADVRRDRADHRRRGTPGMDRGEHGPRLGSHISAGLLMGFWHARPTPSRVAYPPSNPLIGVSGGTVQVPSKNSGRGRYSRIR